MSYKQASVLMAFVVMARSTSYLFSKTALAEVGPLTLLALRFLLAFAVLCLIFGWKKIPALNVRTLAHGAVLGVNLAAVMFVEMLALRIADTTVIGFLVNTAVVIVPLLSFVLFRQKVSAKAAAGACVALAGVMLLTLGGGLSAIGPGHALCLAEAVLYALLIVLTGRFSHEGDPVALGMVQLAAGGALCLAAAFVFEVPALPATTAGWGSLAVLVLVCSVFGYTFQPVAQSRISAEQAGMTCALNPVCSSVLGVAVLGEQLGPLHIAGASLILASLLFTAAPARPRIPLRRLHRTPAA